MSDTNVTPADPLPPKEPGVVAIDPPSDRPEYLLDKYDSVEDQAKAYIELQKQMGKPKEGEEPTDDPLEGLPEELPPASTVKELLGRHDIDVSELEQTFVADGELSTEQYDQLNTAGYSKEMVDNYLQGQAAKAQAQFNEVFADVPSRGSDWQDVSGWAQGHLGSEDREVFNETMKSGTVVQQRAAVRELYAKHKEAVGSEGNLVSGTPAPSGGTRYESKEQMRADMRSDLYQQDPAFRKKVLAKVARSGYANRG